MHPEADAFLDAIFAEPDDDTPRLVYADWLDEHGQTNYAAFIRQSVAIDRAVIPPDERDAMRRERFTAWERMRAERPDAFRRLRLQVNDFPRGLCRDSLELPAAEFARTCHLWWPVITPRHLTLTEPDGHEAELAAAAYLANVRSVVLRNRPDYNHGIDAWVGQPVGEAAVMAVVGSPHTARLRGLKVESCRLSAVALASLRDSELVGRLDELDIGVRLADETEVRLFETRHYPESIRDAIRAFLVQFGHRLVGYPATTP